LGGKLNSKAKVAKLAVVLLVEENVLRFDISVNDLLTVEVGKCFKYLSEYFPLGLLLVALRMTLQEVIQGFTLAILHLDVEYSRALFRLRGANRHGSLPNRLSFRSP
jgi:hypothetical protein